MKIIITGEEFVVGEVIYKEDTLLSLTELEIGGLVELTDDFDSTTFSRIAEEIPLTLQINGSIRVYQYRMTLGMTA